MFGAIWLCWDLTQRYRSGEPLLTELDKTAAWRQALVISFWFALNYILLTGSNPYVDGPIEVLCTQMPVMLGLVFNRVLLRKTYSWFSWLGGFLVLVASCVSIFRMLADKDAAGTTNLGWAVVYLIGNAPLGIMAPLWEMTCEWRVCSSAVGWGWGSSSSSSWSPCSDSWWPHAALPRTLAAWRSQTSRASAGATGSPSPPRGSCS